MMFHSQQYLHADLWDPLATLCNNSHCYPAKDDRLLFLDRHHLSVYGSELLAPGFEDFIKNIKKSGSH